MIKPQHNEAKDVLSGMLTEEEYERFIAGGEEAAAERDGKAKGTEGEIMDEDKEDKGKAKQQLSGDPEGELETRQEPFMEGED